MNTYFIKTILSILGVSIFLASCGDKKKQFHVEGTVNNADSLTLYLEKRGHSDITIIDSVKLTSEGNFAFNQEALAYPEFYRLRLDKQTINFSVDSTESITIKAEKATFATKYDIEGSYNSARIKEAFLLQLNLRGSINRLQTAYNKKEISDQAYLDSVNSIIEDYKEKARNMILDDYKSTAAYFALFQKIDDMLIFDPYDKKDLNLFRAVATVWDTYYPNSPRTELLKKYTLTAVANIKAIESQQGLIDKIEGSENIDNKDYFAVSLPDKQGKEVSTKSLRGKVVLLDFTAYSTEYSVAHNIRLNQVYEKHKSNLEIYQISFDVDKHRWLNTATNLPWICVRDNQSLSSPLLPKFNVEGLPSTYILNKSGDIVKKIGINDNLEKELAKVL